MSNGHRKAVVVEINYSAQDECFSIRIDGKTVAQARTEFLSNVQKQLVEKTLSAACVVYSVKRTEGK